MNALVRGLWGLAVGTFASLASAQTSNEAGVEAPRSAPSAVPAAARTVSLAPHPSENLPSERRQWYGWQSLVVDGGASALVATALVIESGDSPDRPRGLVGPLLVAAAIGYGTGGPMIHLSHDQPWRALGSFGLRAGLPILGVAIAGGSATCPASSSPGDSCGLSEFFFGVLAGTVLAIAIDDGFLAWEDPTRGSASQARLGLAPAISSDGRRELRVVGTF